MNDIKNKINQNIISLFGIDKMPEEKQEEMINRIGKIIFQSVLIRVLPLLGEEDVAEYEKLVEKETMPDDILDFFFKKVPSFFEIIVEESEKLKKETEGLLK